MVLISVSKLTVKLFCTWHTKIWFQKQSLWIASGEWIGEMELYLAPHIKSQFQMSFSSWMIILLVNFNVICSILQILAIKRTSAGILLSSCKKSLFYPHDVLTMIAVVCAYLCKMGKNGIADQEFQKCSKENVLWSLLFQTAPCRSAVCMLPRSRSGNQIHKES